MNIVYYVWIVICVFNYIMWFMILWYVIWYVGFIEFYVVSVIVNFYYFCGYGI